MRSDSSGFPSSSDIALIGIYAGFAVLAFFIRLIQRRIPRQHNTTVATTPLVAVTTNGDSKEAPLSVVMTTATDDPVVANHPQTAAATENPPISGCCSDVVTCSDFPASSNHWVIDIANSSLEAPFFPFLLLYAAIRRRINQCEQAERRNHSPLLFQHESATANNTSQPQEEEDPSYAPLPQSSSGGGSS